MIVHGILTIIEYLNITPISAWLNVIARGNIDADVGTRAVGAFGYVHGLGFFGTFFILYALYIIFEYPNNYLIRYLAYISVFFSIVNTGLSFSRAAWLATAVGVVSFLLPRWRSRRLNRLFPIVGVTVLSIIVALLSLNAETLGRFNSTVSSFIDGAKWVFGNQSIDESKIQFVTGRINHGWENAIAVWFENPLFGRLIIQGNIFVGDGGYTAMLAQQGLVGLVGFVGWCTLICRQLPPRSYCDIRQATVLTHMNCTFVVTILTASLATGAAFSERILELLPILLMTLQMLPVQQKA